MWKYYAEGICFALRNHQPSFVVSEPLAWWEDYYTIRVTPERERGRSVGRLWPQGKHIKGPILYTCYANILPHHVSHLAIELDLIFATTRILNQKGKSLTEPSDEFFIVTNRIFGVVWLVRTNQKTKHYFGYPATAPANLDVSTWVQPSGSSFYLGFVWDQRWLRVFASVWWEFYAMMIILLRLNISHKWDSIVIRG